MSDACQHGESATAHNHYLCPSARCEEGAILLGVLRDDGTVGLLPQRIIMDRESVQLAESQGYPEKRFRFANSCAEDKCAQWTGKKCGVIGVLFTETKKKGLTETPKKCSIREVCRWFDQEGISACSVCPLVITDH